VESLSDDEIRAFARAFRDPIPVRQVLAAADWPEEKIPVWESHPEQYWREVSSLLSVGRVTDGRRRLLAAAAEEFPANPLFAAGAGTTLTQLRRIPPADLLPAPPAPFVPRDMDAAVVCTLLCRSAPGQVVALVGMGGVGKSTLAKYLARDPAVTVAFPDGVAWVDVGQNPVVSDILAQALEAFGDSMPVREATDGIRRLRSLLTGASALIVLDDVWAIEVLEAFPVPAGVRLLVTTRSKEPDVLFAGAAVHDLAEADADTARRVLASYAGCAPDELPPAAEEILTRCGGLLLALALAGSMIFTGRRWEYVAKRLRSADLAAIRGRFPGYPHPTLLAALDVSVQALSDTQAQRFRKLAVFKGLGAIPQTVIVDLWQTTGSVDGLEAEDLIDQFARNCLVQVDPCSRAVRLHDLLFDYARTALNTEQLRQVHGQLAHWLLERWGGLTTQPPLALLPDPAAHDDVDRYALRAVVTHLLAADEPATVDCLLDAERPAPGGRTESVWYIAHENAGTTATYLAGIHAAWRDADRRQAAGRPVLSRQSRYALLIGSITGMAAHIPPALLTRLVDTQLWPPARALTYAQTIPDPVSRVVALKQLAACLPADQRRAALAQILAAASAIDEPDDRARALVGLAPYLPADWLDRVLATATTIDEPLHRAHTWVGPTMQLPADLLDQVLAAVDGPDDRADVQMRLAPNLPADLIAVAQILASATTLDEPDYKAERLARLAPNLPDDLLAGVLAQFLAAAAAIDEPFYRVEALVKLAPYLSVDLLAQALAVATTIDEPDDRAEALARLAPYLSVDLLAQALAVATTIDEPDDRAEALARLAPYLPAEQRGPILAQALAAATTIRRPDLRAEVLVGLAPYLPVDLVTQALAAATAIDRPKLQAEALVGLVPHLPDEQHGPILAQALAAATAIDEPFYQARALVGLVPHLPDEQHGPVLAQALAAATAIDRPNLQVEALVGLVPHLPSKQHGPVLAQALAAATAIDWPADQADALVGLVPHLPAEQRERVLDQALASAAAANRAAVVRVLTSALAEGLVAADEVGVPAAELVQRVQRWWP
jgi:hypothetical protein